MRAGPGAGAVRGAVAAAQERLCAGLLPGGLCAYQGHSRQPSMEATAWATLALGAEPRWAGAVQAMTAGLRACQNPDGGWPEQPGRPSDIRTAHAILCLAGLGLDPPAAALGWLAGRRRARGGWAWNEGAWSMPEPTALAILALAAGGALGLTSRIGVAHYLLGLQCADGGWSSHQAEQLGAAQAASPAVTAWVLQALAALGLRADGPGVRRALGYLREHALATARGGEPITPYTGAVTLLALGAWRAEPAIRAGIAGDLIATQAGDGTWEGNYLWTALAIRALSELSSPPSPTPARAT